jgi:hypothetical protein
LTLGIYLNFETPWNASRPEQIPIEALELEQAGDAGKRIILINARPVQRDGQKQMLVAVEDVTVQKRAERILFVEQERLMQSVEAGAAELAQTVEPCIPNRLAESKRNRPLTTNKLATRTHPLKDIRSAHPSLSYRFAKR